MNDRRKVHPKENRYISFWKENLISKHHRVNMGTIISDFLLSKEYDLNKGGMPFARCMLGFLTKQYGSFESLNDNQLDSLREILKFRLKQFQE